jgi:cytochrome P450
MRFVAELILPMHLVLAGPEANAFVWSNNDVWSYSRQRSVLRAGFDDTYLLQLDGEAHRKKRRQMKPAFMPGALAPLATGMDRALCAQISALGAETSDLRDLCRRAIFTMTSYALLQRVLPTSVDQQIGAIDFNLFVGYILGRLQHPWFQRAAYQRLKRDWFAMVYALLDERAADPPAGDDILSHILHMRQGDRPAPSREEIAADIFMLLEAGWDTTTHLLIWALLYVYQNPQWLAALREEARDFDPATFKHISDWPLLEATIFEIERLRPPVPYFILIPGQDFVFQGVAVPEGTPIFYAATLAHFMPDVYADPLDFKPQRFLEDASLPIKEHSTYGSGKHFCLGKPLARFMVLLALVQIVTHYDMVFATTPSLRVAMKSALTPAEATLPMRLIRRAVD